MAKNRSDDGEPDMDAPGLHGYGMGDMESGGNKVMPAGNYKGQKGAGAMHGHMDMTAPTHGHQPMPTKTKHGHGTM